MKTRITTILPTPNLFRRIMLILLASVIFSLNMKSFVATAELIPGGFSGISVLIQRATQKFTGASIPFTALYWTLNAFPIFISFRFIGRNFTLLSLLMIIVSSLLTDFIPPIIITADPLLCSVFGGIINGLAITMCLYADATSGGTDFIAIYFSERKGIDMWNYIFAMNVLVLVVAGIIFGLEKSLYSIIFQFSSTQVLNWLYRHYQKSTMLIITEHPDELYGIIKETTNHDATKFAGTGCYKGSPKTMLYTVVSTDEVTALTRALKKQDRDAFINVLRTQGIIGKFFTRVKD